MTEAEILQTMRRLKIIAWAMDAAWQVPFTKIRVGIDPLVGLIPGGGDLAGMVVSLYLVLKAHHMGAPRNLILRMLANVAIDSGLGTVPLFGDVFDALFKSNIMNYDLLVEFLKQKGIQVPA